MPKIPTYRQQVLPSTNVGAAPINMNAAYVQGGAVGQGIASIGQGIGNLGESMFKIKMMDMDNKDSLAEIAFKNDIRAAETEYETKKNQ